jgi:hypothetical protein
MFIWMPLGGGRGHFLRGFPELVAGLIAFVIELFRDDAAPLQGTSESGDLSSSAQPRLRSHSGKPYCPELGIHTLPDAT